jgi:hypothetical protein
MLNTCLFNTCNTRVIMSHHVLFLLNFSRTSNPFDLRHTFIVTPLIFSTYFYFYLAPRIRSTCGIHSLSQQLYFQPTSTFTSHLEHVRPATYFLFLVNHSHSVYRLSYTSTFHFIVRLYLSLLHHHCCCIFVPSLTYFIFPNSLVCFYAILLLSSYIPQPNCFLSCFYFITTLHRSISSIYFHLSFIVCFVMFFLSFIQLFINSS